MRYRALVLLFLLFLLPPAPAAAQGVGGSVVTIYTTLQNGRVRQGTGFAVGDGTIATAYHVVQGAARIELVTTRAARTSQVMVRSVSPDTDLALLTTNADLGLRPLRLAPDSIPSTGEALRMVGTAAGIPNSTYSVNLVHEELIPVASLNDKDGRPLFEDPPNLPILHLAGIIYGGISGGPLLNGAGEVIGVLCGSRDEGGAYGFAIPAGALLELIAFQADAQPVSAETSWPPLRLTSDRLRSMEYFVTVDKQAETLLNAYIQNQNTLRVANSDLGSATFLIGSALSSARIRLDVYRTQAEFPSFEWQNLRELSARAANALEARGNADRNLRLAAARLNEAMARNDMDSTALDSMRRQIELLNSNHRNVAADTFERMHGIELPKIVNALRSIPADYRSILASEADIDTFMGGLRSLETDLGRFAMSMDFISWTSAEGAYFDAVGQLLERNYEVIVYVPEPSS